MTLSRKTPMKRSPINRAGLLSVASVQLKARAKKAASGKRMKSKQRAVTAAEKIIWNRLATEVGCIACRLDGRENYYVSIHHVDGRTKPGCHKKVLPLCGPHHQQDDTDPLDRVAIHPNKAEFELIYGTQERLMALCLEIMEGVA